MEPTTGYSYVGSFTSPGIDTIQKGPTAYNGLMRKTLRTRVNVG